MFVRFTLALAFSTSLHVTLAVEPLSGTKLLTETRPLDEVMVAGIDQFAVAELERSIDTRPVPSPDSRNRLAEIIGAVDPRLPATGIELHRHINSIVSGVATLNSIPFMQSAGQSWRASLRKDFGCSRKAIRSPVLSPCPTPIGRRR